jgi:glycosyltransferase involved in cell wall biosynthesis
VPSHNHGRYLGACLDSIHFQEYDNLEIIIVDDASTDDSRAVIERFVRGVREDRVSYACDYDTQTDIILRREHPRYRQDCRRLIVLENETNQGSTQTYNRGLRVASGKYCAVIPCDDYLHPDMISMLTGILEKGPADFAYSDMFVIDDDFRILRRFSLPEYSFKESFCHWYLCGVSKLYRRELHERFGYFDETADADDHECYLRFALGGARFQHTPMALYSVRSHHTRQFGLHAPERFRRLLDHSKRLVMKARKSILAEDARCAQS